MAPLLRRSPQPLRVSTSRAALSHPRWAPASRSTTQSLVNLILTQKDNYQLEILVKLLDKVDDEKTLQEIKLMVKIIVQGGEMYE